MTRRASARRRSSSLLAAALTLIAVGAMAQESDFFAQKRAYFRDEIVQGASKHPESPAEAPATVTLVTAEDIRRYGFRTLADVLNFASLGNFTHNDRRYDFAGSRGLFFFEDFNTRVLVMLNGHPLNEPWNNFAGLGREMLVPLELAERIEIVYGPSALLYGGYSLYGLVNVVTHSGGSLAGTRVMLRTGAAGEREATVSYGAEGVAGAQATRWNVLGAGGVYRSSGDNLDLPVREVGYPVNNSGSTAWGGPQSGTDFEKSPFGFLHAQYGELSLMARAGYRRKGVPLAPYETIYGSRDSYVRDDKSFVDAMWEHELGWNTSLTVRAFSDWYTYAEHDPYAATEDYPAYLFVLQTNDSDRGGELRLSTHHGTHTMAAGAEYRRRSIFQRSFNDVADGPRDAYLEDRVSGSLFVGYFQEEWRPSQQWTVVAGGNIAKTEPGGRKAQPRVAAIYKPRSDVAIKGLYGRGFRPPSIFEAGYVDYIDQIDNPALRSEEIASSELSLTWDIRPQVQAQAYAFDSKLKGLIRATVIESVDQIQGGVLPPDGDINELIGARQYQSFADVKSHGFGVSTRFNAAPLRGYVNVAWAKAHLELGSGSQDLPASPSWLASAALSYEWRDLVAGVAAQYIGSQLLDPSRGDSTRTSDYLNTTFRIGYETRLSDHPLTVFVEGRNALNADGAIAASPVYSTPVVPMEKRRIGIGLEARF